MKRRVILVASLGVFLAGGGALWLWHLRNFQFICNSVIVQSENFYQCRNNSNYTIVAWFLIVAGILLFIAALLDHSVSMQRPDDDQSTGDNSEFFGQIESNNSVLR
jgi:hypothetical protein